MDLSVDDVAKADQDRESDDVDQNESCLNAKPGIVDEACLGQGPSVEREDEELVHHLKSVLGPG